MDKFMQFSKFALDSYGFLKTYLNILKKIFGLLPIYYIGVFNF